MNQGPTTEQLSQAKEMAFEEIFAIHFMYMVDWQKYGKIIEDMENKALQKKIHSQRTLVMCVGCSMVGKTIMVDDPCALRQMMGWYLQPCPRKRINKRKPVRQKKSHVSGARRLGTTK